MTGQNKEKEIVAKGDEEMWNTCIPLKDTFFSKFRNPLVIDLPGFNYDKKQHAAERRMLEEFFNEKDREKKMQIRKDFNRICFEHHKKIKKEFFKALEKDHDLVLGYFSVADVIGHLNFGNRIMMKMIYKELDEIAEQTRNSILKKGKLIIISDHGMKALGMFGEHSHYGFWSTSFKTDLENPRITDFYDFVTNTTQ
jgi:hypothetical protein